MHFLTEAFREKRSQYIALERAFIPLLERAANEAGVQIFRLESRVKDADSFEGKITREDKVGKYTLLQDVTDLCGLRVVLFDTDACSAFAAMVRAHFDIDDINSVDKSRELGEDRFGYQSTHLVISLSEQRRGLIEYNNLVGLKAELQIRTVLQHAWSVLDHKLRYKSPIEAPRELRRKLFRISALLEAADEAFLEINKASATLRAEYNVEVGSGQLDIGLNRDSLSVFVEQSARLQALIAECERSGIRVNVDLGGGPPVWSYLINSLLLSKIDTLSKLESALGRVSGREIATLKEIFESSGVLTFGIYTFLRDAVLTIASRDDVVEVLRQVPTNEPLARVEGVAFERLERYRQDISLRGGLETKA